MAFLFSYWRGSPAAAEPSGEGATQGPQGGDAHPTQQPTQTQSASNATPRGATVSPRSVEGGAGGGVVTPITLQPLLHRVQYNDDCSCVVVVPAHQKSFEIYKLYENENGLKLGFTFRKKQTLNDKQLGLATMMGRSNVAAFVGGGEYPVAPPNKVVLWNLKNCDLMAEISATENEPVLSVQLRKKFIAISTAKYTQIFDFDSTVSLQKWTTQNNPTGALAVSGGDESDAVIACPGREVGHVQVVYFDYLDDPIDLHPHNREVSALAISRDGKHLATTSTKGTVIRVYELNRESAQPPLPRVLRRGRADAAITCLCFSPDKRFICASSDHETIHVWDLNAPTPGYQLNSIYYKGEKSFGQFISPYPRAHCGFSPCSSIIFAISDTGHILFLKVNPETGAIDKIKEDGIKELKELNGGQTREGTIGEEGAKNGSE